MGVRVRQGAYPGGWVAGVFVEVRGVKESGSVPRRMLMSAKAIWSGPIVLGAMT